MSLGITPFENFLFEEGSWTIVCFCLQCTSPYKGMLIFFSRLLGALCFLARHTTSSSGLWNIFY